MKVGNELRLAGITGGTGQDVGGMCLMKMRGVYHDEGVTGGESLGRGAVPTWLRGGSGRLGPDRPPLTVYDIGLALVMGFLMLIENGADTQTPMNPALLLLALPLIWRRQYPTPVFGVTVLAAVFANTLINHSLPAYSGLATIMIAAYSVGAHGKSWFASLCLMLGTATAVALTFGSVLPRLPDFAGAYIVLLPLWLAGQAIRSRQLRADAFEDKATRLEHEQELARQAARTAERARIARELHDVVAHSVSVMVVQAGAARHIVATSPAQAHEALGAVESVGREAMAELRRLLGVLNCDGEDDSGQIQLAPQPGAEQLSVLVRRVREAGLPVSLRIIGQTRTLSSGINLAVYRIAQEALTNALKYAGQAPTVVSLTYTHTALELEIRDEGRNYPGLNGSGTGHGLAGMKERVTLYGGRLDAGPHPEGGFLIRAWLPLEVAGQ